ncbi:MAG: peptidase M64 [Planctomycetes bacterium]|nr:peptidase M64 [Planctomycetota bacterium]
MLDARHLLPLLLLAPVAAAQVPGPRFTGKTLRFDYQHSGTATEEQVSLEEIRAEGDWAGPAGRLVDDTNLGKYLFQVVDLENQQVLYSSGFSSIYGEWETTGEAKKMRRSFHESMRFPEPTVPAQLVLKKRQPDGSFRELHSLVVDPASRFVNRAPITPRGMLKTHFDSGPAAKCVDLLVLGEGYTAQQSDKFEKDVERLGGALFATEPFKSRKSQFSLRSLLVPSMEPGISNPRKGIWRDAPLGLSFNAFDSDRYVLTYANRTLREAAAQAPYDALIILFNDRKYGGGGIFNLWATVASDTEPAPYVFVHEFGHSFAGLADEYYSSQVSYENFNPPGSEPWEPNVTALLDPAKLKWRDLVAAGTPIPSPWDKERYDKLDLEYQAKRKAQIERKASEEDAEALMREVKASTKPLLEGEKLAGKVGAFEGAMYEAKGLYRPEVDCIMFTRNPTFFCKVCTRAIERVIERLTH